VTGTGSTPAPARLAIRSYRPDDRDAVYDVCVRTGDSGGDASGKYSCDDILPDIYAGPYLYLEPRLAFVLVDGGQPVGYVLGTADTATFVSRYRQQWIPRLAERYPPPPDPPASPDDEQVSEFYRPERLLRPGLRDYPAHLHIDILPPYQGAGHGRDLIGTFVDAAAGAGAPGVHVSVGRSNTRAQAFYRRVGFEPVQAGGPPGTALYFGRVTRVRPED
jgi:ribosomal protein S18 acetylase RimI-like enzyme